MKVGSRYRAFIRQLCLHRHINTQKTQIPFYHSSSIQQLHNRNMTTMTNGTKKCCASKAAAPAVPDHNAEEDTTFGTYVHANSSRK
jgi:hypothetical protein